MPLSLSRVESTKGLEIHFPLSEEKNMFKGQMRPFIKTLTMKDQDKLSTQETLSKEQAQKCSRPWPCSELAALVLLGIVNRKG